MKIVNEKGKLFGLINIVDLLVLLIIVAVVGVFASALLQDKVSDVVAAKEDYYFEVEVIGATSRYFNEIERLQADGGFVGKNLVAGNTYQDATIEAFWYEPYIFQTTDAEGKIHYETDPVKKSVVLLIKAPVSSGTATPSVANQDVRVGRTFILKTQTTETTGTIRYAQFGSYTKDLPAEAVKKQ